MASSAERECARVPRPEVVSHLQCYTRPVRTRLIRLLTCALLALQLAVGMHWPLAQAMAAPAPARSPTDQVQPCPEHAGAVLVLAERGALQRSHAPHESRQNKRDCCQSTGCQGHCVDMPGIAQLTSTGLIQTSTHLPPDFRTPAAPARPGQRFRPPIA